jgi:glycosyltransferase involved in cell wall biosynthesis
MNKDKKTLVILTPGFPKDEADSTCLPMQQQLIRALKVNDASLNIIILSFQYPYHLSEYRWYDIKVIPFNGRNKGGISRFILRGKINAALEEIHKQTPVTSLLSFWYGECASIGHKFASKYGLGHFCWILGQDAKKANKYPGWSQLRSHELIALSDFLLESFQKNHGVKPAHVIPPGIDPSLFSQGEKNRDIDITGVGSLIPLKRFDLFIEILAEIKKKLPAIKAVLIGNGPEKEKLQSLVIQSGLVGTITLTGEVPYPEVLNLMQRSKLLLHTSGYEGFSGVCLEALYAGCHVVSFCKPMKADIEQWHIVTKKEEMTQTALHILEDTSMAYNKITFATMEDVAKNMVDLFFKRV